MLWINRIPAEDTVPKLVLAVQAWIGDLYRMEDIEEQLRCSFDFGRWPTGRISFNLTTMTGRNGLSTAFSLITSAG